MTETPSVLYGVKDPAPYSIDGAISQVWYLSQLPKGGWGRMKDRIDIVYFHDEAARSDFRRLFGGTTVTLSRKASTVSGLEALRRRGS